MPLARSFGLTPSMMCLIGIPSCPSGHSWAAISLIASWVGDPLCCRLSLVRRTRGAAGAAASPKAAGQIFASARGTLASRRSTVAVLGSGAALLLPAFAPDRLQRAPRTQVVMPGGRGPEPPEANGYEPPPQDATPRSVFRIVSRTRPQCARLTNSIAQLLFVVNI